MSSVLSDGLTAEYEMGMYPHNHDVHLLRPAQAIGMAQSLRGDRIGRRQNCG